VQSFKQSVLSKNNPQNLHLMKIQRNLEDFDKRKEILKKANRWESFKQRRVKALNKYLDAKRRQYFIKEVII